MTTLATFLELLGNIVQVLCEAGAFYPRGGCNADLSKALTQEQLVPLLQDEFPDSDWTDEQFENISFYGRKHGALFMCNSADPVTYMIRLDMAMMNPQYAQYAEFCPEILSIPWPANIDSIA